MTNSIPGQRRRASATLVPVFTPKRFASTLAAMHTVVSASIGTTPSGLPRSLGSTCCSTEAKYELKSTNRERSTGLEILLESGLPATTPSRAPRARERPIGRLHELAPEDERIGDVRDGLDR